MFKKILSILLVVILILPSITVFAAPMEVTDPPDSEYTLLFSDVVRVDTILYKFEREIYVLPADATMQVETLTPYEEAIKTLKFLRYVNEPLTINSPTKYPSFTDTYSGKDFTENITELIEYENGQDGLTLVDVDNMEKNKIYRVPFAFGLDVFIMFTDKNPNESQPPVIAPAPAEKPTLPATPTAAKVYINEKPISFDAYTIDGNNYFKLRDLAYSVNGSDKQFDVSWDETAKAINLLSNKAYTVAGGEMTVGDGTSKTSTLNINTILLDGKEIHLSAYTIGGNNYFKLRDIGKLFNFATDWDGTNNAIKIDTAKPYTE